VAARVPRFAITGFSLGGNLTLLTLSRERKDLPRSLFAAAAICPPLDMSACASALERRWNRVYQFQFVSSLNRSYRRRQKLRPDVYEAGRERGVSTVREFDSRITAFYGGYRDAEDYYERVSPGPRLGGIDRRTLILAAGDDPFIPAASMRRWSETDAVSIEIADGGGHVGFVGRSTAPGRFWAADRVLGFLESVDRDA
jgi:predicted alpha/beta-fold hydrolase